MTKIEHIESILERRILHGDYLLSGLPAERELCEETGASRTTTRKAIERLMQKGLLQRLPNRRLTVNRSATEEHATFAFLVPSISSGNVERWRLAIENAVRNIDSRVRTILYVHWDDPVLYDTLKNFEKVFLFPSYEDIPDRIVARLKEAGRSLVVLEKDLTSYGIASVCMFPAFFTQRLLDVLGELGHRNVDCFNVQTIDPFITSRIEQWNLWRGAHRIKGQCHSEPLLPYTPYEAQLKWAYEQMSQILAKNALKASGLFCTTAIAAIGAMRAMRDRGIKTGEDISVCTISDEGLAHYMSPSVTCIELPDPKCYIRMCIERMQSKDKQWMGSLLVQPSQPQLFIGESTGRAKG